MGGEENIDRELKNFKEKMERDFRVERLIIFGSRAEGKSGEHSDIDLMIVSPDFEEMDYFDRAARMYDYWDSLVLKPLHSLTSEM